MKHIRTAASAALLALTPLMSNLRLAIAAPAVAEDIRDIRAPLPIPPWWHWPLAIALAVSAVTAIGLLLRYWYIRRHRPLTPVERARKALELAEELAKRGHSHDWAELVAATVRGALAVRIGESVLPQTTHEFAKAPWAKDPANEGVADTVASGALYLPETPQLLALLEVCDLARFANANLAVAALLAATASAKELLELLLVHREHPKPGPVARRTPPPDSEPVPPTLRTGVPPNNPPQAVEQVSP